MCIVQAVDHEALIQGSTEETAVGVPVIKDWDAKV